MGVGCYYTHKELETVKAFWIDTESYDDEALTLYLLEDLAYIFENLGYQKDNQWAFFNGLYDLILESTYYSDGLVLRLEPSKDSLNDYRLYNLAMANHARAYDRIKRALLPCYTLKIATSGYTSTLLN